MQAESDRTLVPNPRSLKQVGQLIGTPIQFPIAHVLFLEDEGNGIGTLSDLTLEEFVQTG